MQKLFIVALLAIAADARYFSSNLIRTPLTEQIYDPNVSSRIVNGEPAEIAEFPHMLALLDFTRGGFRCGASNIHPLWSLTAAHCTDIGTPPSQINLRGGSTNRLTGGFIFFVQQYWNHPLYNRRTLEYDIAIIQVQADTRMEGHLHVTSIALPNVCGNDNCCGVCNDAFVTTSGWGLNENGILPINLQQLTKPIHDRADCNRIWGGGIGPSLFCKAAFDGRDTCNGDSGSPLVTGTGASRLQVGVVSFGSSVCGDGTAPSGNVRVEHAGVRDWIRQLSTV